jgi:cyclin-dependent kinase 8/11
MELPDANKINFIDSPGVHLSTLVPHVDAPPPHGPHHPHFAPAEQETTPVDLIQRLLIYPPDSRFKAVDALKHPYLFDDGPLVLPRATLARDNIIIACAADIRDGRTAGEWLRTFLDPDLQ